MSCIGCTLPVFYVSSDTATTTIQNVKILNFNTPATSPSFYAPLLKFDLSQPYSSPLITPKVTLTNFQVDTFTGDIDATGNSGRILEFKYVTKAGELVPTTDQVSIV